MAKYLVLYRSEAALSGPGVAAMLANTPPEQMAKGMEAWTNWFGKYGSSVVDMGAPLDHSASVTGSGVESQKTAITGYSVVEAESQDAVTDMMKAHPHLFAPGSSIEVLECIPMGGS